MADLGRILQQQRASQGLSLEEAERATHISRRYLQALESEDFSAFSSPVFAKGFLRNYSQYLGLDPTQVMTLWPDTDEPAAVPQPPETARAEFERRARPIRERTPYRRTLSTGDAPGPLTRRRLGQVETTPMGGVLALVAAIVVGLVVIAFAASRLAGSRSVPATGSTTVPSGTAASSGGGQPRATATLAPRRAGSMPDLRGKDTATAIRQLQGAGVNPLVITVPVGRNQRAGVVTNQDPSPGTTITTNSAVTLVVSSGAAAAPSAPATIGPRPSATAARTSTPRVP